MLLRLVVNCLCIIFVCVFCSDLSIHRYNTTQQKPELFFAFSIVYNSTLRSAGVAFLSSLAPPTTNLLKCGVTMILRDWCSGQNGQEKNSYKTAASACIPPSWHPLSLKLIESANLNNFSQPQEIKLTPSRANVRTRSSGFLQTQNVFFLAPSSCSMFLVYFKYLALIFDCVRNRTC